MPLANTHEFSGIVTCDKQFESCQFNFNDACYFNGTWTNAFNHTSGSKVVYASLLTIEATNHTTPGKIDLEHKRVKMKFKVNWTTAPRTPEFPTYRLTMNSVVLSMEFDFE